MNRALAVMLAVLLVPLSVLLVSSDAEAAATRTLAITTASADPTVPFAGFDGNPLKVYDIDGDGDLEILAQNDNQWLYIFDSRTGALLAELKTVFPPSWGARTFNGPEVNVMKDDGKVHLILLNSAATLTSYTYDPLASTNVHLGFTKDWERRLSDCYTNPGADSKPVLSDLDRDGDLEIVVSTEESGIYAVRDDGSLLWAKCIGGGNAEPTVADINLDGWPEVVFGSDAGMVTAMNGRTGGTMWSYNLRSNFRLGSYSIPVGVALGQLNGVGGLEVVGGARDSHNTTDYSQDHALLFALSNTGKLLWGKQDLNGGNPLTYTHPIVIDLAKDGTNEVYWGDWNTIGHKGGIPEKDYWKLTGPANFYRYDNQGNLVWKTSLNTYWSNKDLAIGDVDGDGVQEILANGPSTGGDGIWMLDSVTGAKESFLSLHPWKAQRGPILADLHGDGGMDLAIEAGPAASGAGSGGAILTFDLGVAYNAAYPHLPYATLGPAYVPPPPGSSFDATFRVTSPNQYWQQVRVSPALGETVSKVEIQVNDGAWRPMTLQSYGDWTSSYTTPAGSKVEFFATSTGQTTSLSAPFTWMDGTLQKGSNNPPPTSSGSSSGSTTTTTTTTQPPTSTTTTTTTQPPASTTTTTTAAPTSTTSTTTQPPTSTTTTTSSSGFAATFTVPSSVNEWWVEVKVASNEGVSGVDARVNNGTWTPLSKQSWGNWAKSFYVAPGSQVTFRATTTSGAQALSQSFQWGAQPPPPQPGATFEATFSPKAIGNDWWVETAVTANQAVAKVEAQVNGGAWTQLPANDWGTYAKSINAPNGSSVVFRATSTGGSIVTSGPTIWT